MVGKGMLAATAAVLMIAAAGCGSSSKSASTTSSTPAGTTSSTSAGTSATTSGGNSGGSPTYTLGVLTDLTGPAFTNAYTIPKGVQAGIGVAEQEGYKIKYVVADTGSSPTGALTAAQKLVEQNHVFAVVANSALTFAASNYLTSKGIPVIGAAVDSTEWITARNMFSVTGTQDFTKIETTFGLFFKLVGVTNLGAIGYGVSPSSANAAKGSAISAELAGIKVGYLNTSFPFGGTNTAPAVLAMKSAAVNGFTGAVETGTVFAIIKDLKQEGVTLKASLMSTGYGGDLVQGGPDAQQEAQGVYFLTQFEPFELNTPATQKMHSALMTYAGVSGDPTFAEYQGYTAIDAFVLGLKAAGANPTQASFINAMLGIRNYMGAGLYGNHSVGFALDQRGLVAGADNCAWMMQYSGSTFHVTPGADPICGTTVPGKTVSNS